MTVPALVDPRIVKAFIDQQADEKGRRRTQQKTLRKRQTWAVGDIGSPAKKDIFAVNSSVDSNEALVTDEPKLLAGQTFPADMAVMLYAVAVIARMTNYNATIAQAKDTQDSLDSGKLAVKAGGIDLVDLAGPEFMDYGPSFLVGNTDGGATNVDDGRQPTQPRIWCRLDAPLELGDDSVPAFQHLVTRASAWAVTFDCDYYFKLIICRK